MSTKSPFTQAYKVLMVFVLILGVVFSTFSGGNVPSVRAQEAGTSEEISAGRDLPVLSVTPASGGTLRFPIIGAPGSLDPAQFALGSETVIELQIFEGLTQLDQNSNVIPAIASSWTSPDAIVWTFSLRNDVYFQNGRQVKSADFYYSWNRAKTAGGTYAFMFDDIASFSVPDDFTFIVTLTDPSATFPARITMPIFAVIPVEAVNTIGTNPVGTGPFKFASWTAAKITLQKSLNYYDTPAYLDSIDFRFYTDINTEWTDFQASKLDLTPVAASQWNTVKTDPNVITAGTMLMQGFGFDSVFFPDVTVRKALQRAINRATLVTEPAISPYDPAPVANGVISPGKGSYDNSDIVIPYDPNAALTMLASSGWTDTNADGILDNGAGSNLSIVIKDNTGAASHARAVAVANDLSNIGGTGVGLAVSMSLSNSSSTFKSIGWISDYPAPDGDLFPYETGEIFATALNYSSVPFENHLNLARETLDQTARNAEFHAAETQLVLTDAALIPLYYGSMIPVMKKSFVQDLLFQTQGYLNILLKYAWLQHPTCIPTLVLPENGALLDNGRDDGLDEQIWDFDWASCPSATKYHLFVYHTGAISPISDKNALTGSSYHWAASGYIIDGNRFDWKWKVQAYVNGKWGNWSEMRTFDVEPLNSDAPNIHPPSAPVLNLPANNGLVTDYTPRLDWSNSVPIPDHYQVQLSTDANFLTLLYDEAVAGTTSEFTIPFDLSSNTKYFWRVRAVNVSNESSAWSANWSIRAAILPPVLASPTDAAMLDSRRPVLEWDDVAGATGYKLVISKYANLSSPLKSILTVQSNYALPTDLPAKTKLYWRVQATGPNGPSLWPTAWTFTTGNPPATPILAAPALNTLVKDYTPLLNWNNSTLPANTTFKEYQIQVDDNNNFLSPVVDATTAPVDITDSDFTPLNDLAHNTKFYWRVRALNTVGGIDNFSAWSAVRYFRVIIDAPVLSAPANGDTAPSLKPTFIWTDVASNSGYTIQISASPTFGTPILTLNIPTNVSTYIPTTNLPTGKTLYWRVRTRGPNGPSLWSTAFSFSTP